MADNMLLATSLKSKGWNALTGSFYVLTPKKDVSIVITLICLAIAWIIARAVVSFSFEIPKVQYSKWNLLLSFAIINGSYLH